MKTTELFEVIGASADEPEKIPVVAHQNQLVYFGSNLHLRYFVFEIKEEKTKF